MTGLHIYIVEDDDAVRASMVALMSLREDATVHSYQCARAFLDDMETLEPGVLLLDFRLPGFSGMELLAALKEQASPFVTIMLTGHADVALAIRAMKLGAVDFVEKPVPPDRLVSAVDAALAVFDTSAAANARIRRAKRLIKALTQREREVLIGLMQGRPNKAIAHALGISPRTIESHRARLMDRMGVDSLSEMLRVAFDAGLTERSLT